MTNEGSGAVGYTAVWTAYLRSFSDIPLSKELYELLSKREYGQQAVALQEPSIAPQYEARYKILTKLLLESGIDQVLELAAGFSGRGMTLTEKYPLRYVELDLPDVIAEKRSLVDTLRKGKLAATLQLVAGNALNQADMERAVAEFNPEKPTIILNEGLLRYLNFQEKTIVAQHVHGLLERFGGQWITPDISLATLLDLEDKVASGHTENLRRVSGKSIEGNLFDDVHHAICFFEDLGFTIERHSLLEVMDELASPAKLSIAPTDVEKMIAPAHVFVMRVA